MSGQRLGHIVPIGRHWLSQFYAELPEKLKIKMFVGFLSFLFLLVCPVLFSGLTPSILISLFS